MNTAGLLREEVRLSTLLSGEVELPPGVDATLLGIELDSRRLEAGDLFLACKGANADGRDYLDEVIAKGAHAVLVEADERYDQVQLRGAVPVVPVPGLACKLARLAARFYGHPARDLWLMGITGTNGKTSVCHFIAQAYQALGQACGVCGTLGWGLAGEALSSDMGGPSTTPDAVTLQRIFNELRGKARVMAMEVTSHGLRQRRVNIDEFKVAVFTNLSRDHLDYHGSMEAYGEAKRGLFDNPGLRAAVLNQDDPFSATLLNSLPRGVQAVTYSLRSRSAAVHARQLDYLPGGMALDLVTPWGEGRIDSPLLGAFNASNLLAALTAVGSSEAARPDFDFARLLSAFAALRPVPGRMEVIGRRRLGVVVDYAHTPDGLHNALLALRQHYRGRLWCVFGCGGNRDKGKRPLMAQIAERLADRLVITDDNPRLEPSAAIIDGIMSGLREPAAVTVESDRARAIALAIEQAEEGDVVLIAGKGHEDYQDVGGRRLVFSDVRQARLCLNRRFPDRGDEP